jgi:uncharacterized OB-fold protein
MSPLPAKPPVPNVETQPFWDATAEGRIDLPRCVACGLVVWYPRAICPDCHSTDLTWETMAGTGAVYSFSVTRAGGGRRWKEHLPFVVAYVRLDEGPTMLTNIVGCDPDSVTIDMAVTAVFDDTGEGNALIRFRPA